jgi:hypothetical protein
MGTQPCTGRAGAREAEAAARGGTSPRLDVSALSQVRKAHREGRLEPVGSAGAER